VIAIQNRHGSPGADLAKVLTQPTLQIGNLDRIHSHILVISGHESKRHEFDASPAVTEDERAPLFYQRTFNSETSILSLPDILEERAGQHWYAKFDMKDDEEHAEKAAPDSHFQKLAGVGHDRRREKKRFRDLDQFFAKGHIFEDGPIGKSTELLE
jgi:hypothetical protein